MTPPHAFTGLAGLLAALTPEDAPALQRIVEGFEKLWGRALRDAETEPDPAIRAAKEDGARDGIRHGVSVELVELIGTWAVDTKRAERQRHAAALTLAWWSCVRSDFLVVGEQPLRTAGERIARRRRALGNLLLDVADSNLRRGDVRRELDKATAPARAARRNRAPSATESRVLTVLTKASGGFVAPPDIEAARGRGRTKVNTIIWRLRLKGHRIESARAARRRGDPAAAEAKGYRLIPPTGR